MQLSLRQFSKVAICSLLLIISSAAAIPNESIDGHRILVRGKVHLRLMPLGASITRGKGSEDGNGYRKKIRELLVSDGYKVNMVGSLKSGSMEDNEHEGWDGLRIGQVSEKAQQSVPKLLPNLITINAGTNDCAQNYDIEKAGDRMEEMLETLWKASPKACIILSTLLVNGDGEIEERVLDVNKQLQALSKEMTAKSKKLILVDMHSSDGPQKEDLVDGTHPDPAGYQKMAKIWFKGIEDAASRGWLESPQVLPGEGTSKTASTTPSSISTHNPSTTTNASVSTSESTPSTFTSRSPKGDSKAPRAAEYPTIALILALTMLVLFT